MSAAIVSLRGKFTKLLGFIASLPGKFAERVRDMVPWEKFGFGLGVIVPAVVIALLCVSHAARSWLLEHPSEMTTGRLLVLLVLLVFVSGMFILAVLLLFTPSHEARLAITGWGLVLIGACLAFMMLPDSHTTSPPVKLGVDILPPYPTAHHWFMMGISANPTECRDSVPIKIVANGSAAYWAEHPSSPTTIRPFVLVLPGHYEPKELRVGLGYSKNEANIEVVKHPDIAEIDKAPSTMHDITWEVIHPFEVVKKREVNPRDITVVSGNVTGWARLGKPLIVEAQAPWITHWNTDGCTMQLPPLLGTQSVAALTEEVGCLQLGKYYGRDVCSGSSPTAGSGTRLASPLEVNRAVSVVIGHGISSPEPNPPPTTVDDNLAWVCGSGLSGPPKSSGAGGVSAQGSCDGIATILVSTWHRDFVIALIGAFLAVGVHMLFQAMADAITRQEREEGRGPALGI